ncbi:MAG: hydrogenase maturation protease, partial [Acetobacteraceae bacterium]|nr:hydrogenase maturation protease [Acetobacteraceae bacterium]
AARRGGGRRAGPAPRRAGPGAGVVGVGSYFRGDDAVGFEVVEALRSRRLPPGVELKAVAGGGVDAAESVRGFDLAVVVDGSATGARAGTVRFWEGAALERLEGGGGGLRSTHGVGLLQALAAARRLEPGSLPRRLVVVGVEVGDVGLGRKPLTPEVARAVPRAASLVLRLLRGGVPPRPGRKAGPGGARPQTSGREG